ncbi:hypothetical protein HU200_062653 [Digitaria exilis]|uniref:F-box domain-containing protein n=1 Tax=Digitaria exilis TaxID=1010633 RepID=A0A835AAN1_9POAL|nr:hypothetical protein HU200_062653 [Digitaria exilis]
MSGADEGAVAAVAATGGCISNKRPRSVPHLPMEIVATEILARLTVKTLLRFRSVCKAWRTAISSDLSLVSAHQKHQPPPSSLLIFPVLMCGRPDDDHRRCCAAEEEEEEEEEKKSCSSMGFYLWDPPLATSSVTLVHAVDDMPPGERRCPRVPHRALAHCDGLVLVATSEGNVHLFNPSARQAVTLPWSPGGVAPPNFHGHQAFGLGRDPRSGAYKAARYFHRQVLVVATGCHELTTGMEVFTVGVDRRWREMAMQPPYPVIPGRTAASFKGSLIWTVDEYHLGGGATSAPGFLRLSLEDEAFGVTPPPPCSHPRLDYACCGVSELRGELCVFRMVEPDSALEMWMGDDAVSPRWELRHAIRDAVWSSNLPRPVLALDDGIVFHVQGSSHYHGYACGYSFQTRAFEEIAKMHSLRGYHYTRRGASIAVANKFFVIPYRESLLQLPCLVPPPTEPAAALATTSLHCPR